MNITVKRFYYFPNCTIGRFSVNGIEIGIYTLEPTFREVENEPIADWKIDGCTAITAGQYNAAITFSEILQYKTPLLELVPGFSEIRIHIGNYPRDTEGCILVGNSWTGQPFINDSKEAFEAVMRFFHDPTEQIIVSVG